MTVYLFDKKENQITVNVVQIHSYNKDSSIKEILYWQYKEKNGKVEDDLHMQTIIECVFEGKKKAKD